MKTSKPISFISWNTEPWLHGKLDELLKNTVIEWYTYIFHKAEKDDTKDHFHVYCEPARLIQTMDIKAIMQEPDLKNLKPRGIGDIRTSKWTDWALYGVHDPDYLASKGETREYHYLYTDMVSPDQDEFSERIRRVKHEDSPLVTKMKNAIQSGMTLTQAMTCGLLPPTQARLLTPVWEAIEAEMRQPTDYVKQYDESRKEATDELLDQIKKGLNISTGEMPDYQEITDKLDI